MKKYASLLKIVVLSNYLFRHTLAENNYNDCEEEILQYQNVCNDYDLLRGHYDTDDRINACNAFKSLNCLEALESPSNFISSQCVNNTNILDKSSILQMNYYCATKNSGIPNDFCTYFIELFDYKLSNYDDLSFIIGENCLHDECRIPLLEYIKNDYNTFKQENNLSEYHTKLYENVISYLENQECLDGNINPNFDNDNDDSTPIVDDDNDDSTAVFDDDNDDSTPIFDEDSTSSE